MIPPHEAALEVHEFLARAGLRYAIIGAIASSLDLCLYLVEKYWELAARGKIAAQMEYRAYSPA